MKHKTMKTVPMPKDEYPVHYRISLAACVVLPNWGQTHDILQIWYVLWECG